MSASTWAKIIGLGVVILAIAFFVNTFISRGKEVKTLTTEVITKDVANKGLTKVIAVTGKSDEINQQTAVAINTGKQTIVEKIDVINTKTNTKVEQANQAYITGLLDPNADKEKLAIKVSREVSAARIEGLWETFCASTPNIAPTPGCEVTKTIVNPG